VMVERERDGLLLVFDVITEVAKSVTPTTTTVEIKTSIL